MAKKFKFYYQSDKMDCGPTCLRMLAAWHGKQYSARFVRDLTETNKLGVSMLAISQAAEQMGFKVQGTRMNLSALLEEVHEPCILHWDYQHFVVYLPGSGKRRGRKIKVADPSLGIVRYTPEDFCKHWTGASAMEGDMTGAALLLEPLPAFNSLEGKPAELLGFKRVFSFLHQSKGKVAWVLLALLIASGIQLAIPLLTQSIVDNGIQRKDLHFITLVLVAQLMLIFSRTVIDFLRSRLLLGISFKINVSILSSFWAKLTKLPLSYFEQHHSGDILQRVSDSRQIQNFLTGPALVITFSLLNLLVFSGVLIVYNAWLFLIFAAGSALYFWWTRYFLKWWKRINYELFQLSAQEKNASLEIVQGMSEIKLNSAEELKRKEWDAIQQRMFRLSFRTLNFRQVQTAGATLINQGKDVLITFMVAKMVIDGHLTLGAMLAIQYIVGQLNGPVEQLIVFLQNIQDVQISMDRLEEVHQVPEEEPAGVRFVDEVPLNTGISLHEVDFRYAGIGGKPVLDRISLEIPQGKVTAIVGASGSGKTTLVKLLLKFFDGYEGAIKVGSADFRQVSPSYWRSRCGAVLQDGYIFNDTVAKNIALGSETPDTDRLKECCRIANALTFIESMPNGFHTRLGIEGVGLSQGQKQRLLIARAIYNDPPFLFLDEATNALDTTNERTITENLARFFGGRTVVVVAHRLSTVKNADNIIVLQGGRIVEQGTHQQLTHSQGKYFELVRDQLELEG